MTNTHQVQISEVVAYFDKIRAEQGEQIYEQARRAFALGMINKPRGDEFLSRAFPDLDLEILREEAKPVANLTSGEGMLAAMRQQIPNMKTQVQFNLFMQAFDTLRLTLNCAFGLDAEGYAQGRDALLLALGQALEISRTVMQLQETPEAATSPAAEEFKRPPHEFQEYDLQKALLSELQNLSSAAELQTWYQSNRERMDRVVSHSLRNTLFDAIRTKRQHFGNN